MTVAPPRRKSLKRGSSENNLGKKMTDGESPSWVGRQITAAYEEHANLINTLKKKLEDSKIREENLMRKLKMKEMYIDPIVHTDGSVRTSGSLSSSSNIQSGIHSFDMDDLPMDEMAHTVLKERNMRQQTLIEVNKKIEDIEKRSEKLVYNEKLKSLKKLKEYEKMLDAKDKECEELRKIAQRIELGKEDSTRQRQEGPITKNVVNDSVKSTIIISPDKTDDKSDKNIEVQVSELSNVSLDKLGRAFEVMVLKQWGRSSNENNNDIISQLSTEEANFLYTIESAFEASQKQHTSMNRSLQIENKQIKDNLEKQKTQFKKEQKVQQERLKQVEVELRKIKAAKKRQDKTNNESNKDVIISQLQEALEESEIEHENLAFRFKTMQNKVLEDDKALKEEISVLEQECEELKSKEKKVEDEHTSVVSAIRRVMNDTIEDKDKIIEKLKEENSKLHLELQTFRKTQES